MSVLKRIPELPHPEKIHGGDTTQYLRRLYTALVEDARLRSQDFNILNLTHVPYVDSRTYGCKADGVKDDTIDLQAAITSIGSNEKALLLAGTHVVSDDMTIPENVTVWFIEGGALNVASGKTVTINGRVNAGLYQIFDGDGSVSGLTQAIYPEWWGAVADGSTDDVSAITSAKDAIGNSGEIIFTNGSYKIDSNLTISQGTTLKFLDGAKIQIESGKVLTMNGSIDAGLQQIFSYPGNVSFGSTGDREIYPQWFGCKGDGSTSDRSNMVQTEASLANGGTITLVGTYIIEDDMSFGSDITLRFTNGSKLSVSLDKTVTINGSIKAGLHQVFTGSGEVSGIKQPIYPHWWGAIGNGSNDDSAAINSGLSVISSGGTIIFPNGTYKLSNDVTSAVDTTMEMIGSAKFSVDSAKTLTINGVIKAGLNQIFSGSGDVAGLRETVYPHWWGAKGNGSNDDSTAIQAAIDTLTNGGTILFPGGTYNIGTGLVINYHNIEFKGIGRHRWGGYGVAKIIADSISTTYMISVTNKSFKMKNLHIDGDDDATLDRIVYLVDTSNPVVLQDVRIENINAGSGIEIHANSKVAQSCYFYRVYVRYTQFPLYLNDENDLICQVVAEGCIFTGEHTAVWIGTDSNYVWSAHFSKCEFYVDSGGAHIRVVNIKRARSVTFHQCWFEPTSDISGTVTELVYVGDSHDVCNLAITDCFFYGNNSSGTLTTTYAIQLNKASGSYIAGNYYGDFNTAFIGTNNDDECVLICNGAGGAVQASTQIGVTNFMFRDLGDTWLHLVDGPGSSTYDDLKLDNLYAAGDVSALTFTDRTPYPKSLKEAVDIVKSVSGKDGEVDHEALHSSIKSNGGRNISALVSAHNMVLQDLLKKGNN
jgi:hypothetical protein